jgi:hypothetical protein
MKSIIFKEYERSSESAKRSYRLKDITGTNQNPHWHTRHDNKTDSKSSGQQLTKINNSGQTDREKGSPGGIKPHHTTARTGDHERED